MPKIVYKHVIKATAPRVLLQYERQPSCLFCLCVIAVFSTWLRYTMSILWRKSPMLEQTHTWHTFTWNIEHIENWRVGKHTSGWLAVLYQCVGCLAQHWELLYLSRSRALHLACRDYTEKYKKAPSLLTFTLYTEIHRHSFPQISQRIQNPKIA